MKRLIIMWVCLTVLFVSTQVSFFSIHYHLSGMADSLLNTPIWAGLLHPTLLFPILNFILIQLTAYGLFVVWLWFVVEKVSEWYQFSEATRYRFGLLLWLSGVASIYLLNAYYYPNSFFATPFQGHPYGLLSLLVLCVMPLVMVTLLACRHRGFAFVLMLLIIITVAPNRIDGIVSSARYSQPNIILIGLDSLRPDQVGYFGHRGVQTPTIDAFLRSASVYTNAYTPLARTFPSWVSILTGKYPLHDHARVNLAGPSPILTNDTLARRLKAAGYLTIYGTDETRFTDITKEYGFDRLIGPTGGAVEFILGGLSDLPLTNLLVNLPVGRWLFPYNYGNRAADMTYEPAAFLRLVKAGLTNRPPQPVFLSIHLCLTHWPFQWATAVQDATVPGQYRQSIDAIDQQLAGLMQILKEAGLLDHSVVVLLSDHGVTLGEQGDRVISKEKYRGDPKHMRLVSIFKLGSVPAISTDFKHDYSLSASFGQGTDVLSLKQNHVLLAMRGYGVDLPMTKKDELTMLFDIAPTVLDYLHLAPMQNIDGISMAKLSSRPVYLETGDKIASIETNQIAVDKVIESSAASYSLDTKSGLVQLTPAAEKTVLQNKQRAIFWKNWLFAKYPSETRMTMATKSAGTDRSKSEFTLKPTVMPPYYVLVNLKTGEWTVDLSSPFANAAPVDALMRKLKVFYGNEV